MTRQNTYFLSDLHLGARYFPDKHAAEKRVVDFLESIRHDAREIYLVGDILDYWYEYRYVVPRGFVRFFGKLAQLSDEGIRITWLIGNHDIWIFDYLPSELGIEVVDGSVVREICGRRFFITHGDDIDDTSQSFKMLRSLFRNKFCQKLYGAIHPRWTIPFALGWSKSSRHAESRTEINPSPQRLADFAADYSRRHPDIDWFVFGHLHILHRERIESGAEVIVLGDWISHFSYAEFDGKTLELKTYVPAAD